MSLAIWDHTVLAATRTQPTLTPARGQYTIYLPQRDGGLSWPRWPVTILRWFTRLQMVTHSSTNPAK